MIGLTTLSQNTEIPNNVLDTLYKIERQYIYLKKQDSVSRLEISSCKATKIELKDKNSLLSEKNISQNEIINTQKNTINNLNQQLKIDEKIYKRKKFFTLIKGIGIGVGGILILTAI